ncbi:MAG: hypothetical protein H7320_18450 [Ferruginibacter sp.]|nr:hypothetical protein [Ferruginibacter sp.]
MLIWGQFNDEENKYVAEIVSVSGKTFECRFVHSWSKYVLQLKKINGDLSGTGHQGYVASVVSNKGGKYSTNALFTFLFYDLTDEDCLLGKSSFSTVIVKFNDGKSYLGDAKKTGKIWNIAFRHSGSNYNFDENGVVLKSGGIYPRGSKASVLCAEEGIADMD